MDVIDPSVEHQTGNSMHSDILLCGRARPDIWSIHIKWGFIVHKSQRDELGKTTGLFLDGSDLVDMRSPVLWTVNMAVHNGRCGRQTQIMRCCNDFDPLLGWSAYLESTVDEFQHPSISAAVPGIESNP